MVCNTNEPTASTLLGGANTRLAAAVPARRRRGRPGYLASCPSAATVQGGSACSCFLSADNALAMVPEPYELHRSSSRMAFNCRLKPQTFSVHINHWTSADLKKCQRGPRRLWSSFQQVIN